jgi:hypothetical protein
MFAVGTITPGAGTADAVALTTLTYLALQGGTKTQVNAIDEIYMGGQAASTNRFPRAVDRRHDR